MAFFSELEKRTVKFVWNDKIPQIDKILRKKNQVGGIMFTDLNYSVKL